MDLNVKIRDLCAELGDVRMQLRKHRRRERELEAEIDSVAGMRNAMVAAQEAQATAQRAGDAERQRTAAAVERAIAARRRPRKPKETP